MSQATRSAGPLVFVGAPASGKSTIGRLLAELRHWQFVDLDEQIEQHTGRTIADIFATDGEPAFRQIEERLALGLLQAEPAETPLVLSLGGGAVLSDATRGALHDCAVVWLEVAADHAAQRAGDGSRRPLLAGGDVGATMSALVTERMPLYREVADFSVDTSTRSADEIVAMVSMWLDAEDPTHTEPERHHHDGQGPA